jgi:enamine deaminase RidA (YjgF/YER057c/UK114 family)
VKVARPIRIGATYQSAGPAAIRQFASNGRGVESSARSIKETIMPAKPIRFLSPETLAKPPGYSYLVETTGPGRTIYFAGQLGLDLDNKLVGAPDDFRAQCTQAFENLQLAITAAGASFKDLVKINSYLVDIGSNIRKFLEVRDRYLNMAAPPASTAVGVAALAGAGAGGGSEAVAVLPARAKPAARRGGRKVKASKRKRR